MRGSGSGDEGAWRFAGVLALGTALAHLDLSGSDPTGQGGLQEGWSSAHKGIGAEGEGCRCSKQHINRGEMFERSTLACLSSRDCRMAFLVFEVCRRRAPKKSTSVLGMEIKVYMHSGIISIVFSLFLPKRFLHMMDIEFPHHT